MQEQSTNHGLAVVTITTGDLYNTIAETTHPRIEAYAKKCGADFHVWRDHKGHSSPGYQKLEIAELLETYERVLYIDTDILVREDAPNLFEIVPKEEIGLLNEGRFSNWLPAKQSFQKDFLPSWKEDPNYYNTGVMVVSRCHANIFEKQVHEIAHFYEQTHLNFQIYRYAHPVFELNYKFNRMHYFSALTGEDMLDCYFLHYAGAFSWAEKNPEIVEQNLKLLKSHDEAWKNGQRNFKRSIYVEANRGGLGDMVALEPVVRYLANNLYPGSNFILHTVWPEVFSHLSDRISIVHGETPCYGKGAFYEFNLTPDDNQKPYHGVTHPTDHGSIKAFGGQIAPIEKQIQLPYEKVFAQYNPVTIHAGAGWNSKTFPVSFWQEIIDGLIEYGLTIALIGNDRDDGPGFVPVDGSRCIDLRNDLTLHQLFGAIKDSKILITNDSSPVHIAGASNCFIGLITVCKPAHLILPYRYGSQTWKTETFGDLLPMKFDPAVVAHTRFDQFTTEETAACLPDPQQIINWVKGLI